jgi:hypothetical protein
MYNCGACLSVSDKSWTAPTSKFVSKSVISGKNSEHLVNAAEQVTLRGIASEFVTGRCAFLIWVSCRLYRVYFFPFHFGVAPCKRHSSSLKYTSLPLCPFYKSFPKCRLQGSHTIVKILHTYLRRNKIKWKSYMCEFSRTSWPLKMGPICWPVTSTLRNSPEERNLVVL